MGIRLDPEPVLATLLGTGAGAALGTYRAARRAGRPARDVRAGPFFRTLVDFMQMTLAKSDLRIAETYTSLVSESAARERLWNRISAEHAACVEALLKITGHESLPTTAPCCRGPYACATCTSILSRTYR